MNLRDQGLTVGVHDAGDLQQTQAQEAAQKGLPRVWKAGFGVLSDLRELLRHQRAHPWQGHLVGGQQRGVTEGKLFGFTEALQRGQQGRAEALFTVEYALRALSGGGIQGLQPFLFQTSQEPDAGDVVGISRRDRPRPSPRPG